MNTTEIQTCLFIANHPGRKIQQAASCQLQLFRNHESNPKILRLAWARWDLQNRRPHSAVLRRKAKQRGQLLNSWLRPPHCLFPWLMDRAGARITVPIITTEACSSLPSFQGVKSISGQQTDFGVTSSTWWRFSPKMAVGGWSTSLHCSEPATKLEKSTAIYHLIAIQPWKGCNKCRGNPEFSSKPPETISHYLNPPVVFGQQ